jgi:ketosteroid isomerase-like protein
VRGVLLIGFGVVIPGSVLAIIHSTGQGRASGAPVEATWAQLVIVRNNKIVLLRSFLQKEQALEAAGLSE